MPSRRKINRDAVRNPPPSPDANWPWFVVRYQLPTLSREVRLTWIDGTTGMGTLTERGWGNFYPLERAGLPVGWKPMGIGESHGIGNYVGRAPLPDPLHYGIVIV